MRSRSKILAFVLAVLMIAGLVPFSIFAVDGDTGSTTQTREEYVTANGGTMLFGTSFDDSSKISGDRVNSSTAGSGSMTRTNNVHGGASSSVDVASGSLKIQSGPEKIDGLNGDIYPVLNTSAANGDNVIIEVSFRINKQISAPNNMMYFVDEQVPSSRVDGVIASYLPLEKGLDGSERIGIRFGGNAEASYEFKVGETVNLALVVEPTTKRVHGYINGEYVDSGVMSLSRAGVTAYDNKKGKGWYPSVNTIRMFQITGWLNQDIEIYDLYAYSNVELPYRTVKANEDAFGYFINKNDAKILSHYDFEDITFRNLGTFADGVYTFEGTETGKQYNYLSADSGNKLLLTVKYGPDEIRKDDGSLNDFLRLNFASPTQNDSHFNTYQEYGTNDNQKNAKDDVIVIHRSERMSA